MSSLGNRDQKKKKLKNTKTFDLIPAGQTGILAEDLEYQSPRLNYLLKTTEEPQAHFPEGSKVIFALGR